MQTAGKGVTGGERLNGLRAYADYNQGGRARSTAAS
jgi:hypothetical protein